MNLKTIISDYGTDDGQVGETSGLTPRAVDDTYQKLIDDAVKGKFITVSCQPIYAVVESEIDDVVMVGGRDCSRIRDQQFYDQRDDEDLCSIENGFPGAFSLLCFGDARSMNAISVVYKVYRSCNPAIFGNQLYSAYVS